MGATVGKTVGAAVGANEGDVVGCCVGECDGTVVGSAEGSSVGKYVGVVVGKSVGVREGDTVGDSDGCEDGTLMSLVLGDGDDDVEVGDGVGEPDCAGKVGTAVGELETSDGAEGASVGLGGLQYIVRLYLCVACQ